MRQVLRSHSRLGDGTVEGLFTGAPGAAERIRGMIRQRRVETLKDGAHEAGKGLAHEEGDAPAQGREDIALRVGQAQQQALEAEPAQVISHAALGVALGAGVEERADALAQRAIGDAHRRGGEGAQGSEEGHGAWIAPAQGGGALTIVHRGEHDALDGLGGDGAVLRHALEGQQAVVDVPAQCPQARQVAQVATDLEVVGIIEGCLGAERLVELEVLLDASVLVIEAQAGLDAGSQHASAEVTWSVASDAALEEQLHPVGTADIEVVADHFLEEFAAVQGAIEDLGEADLHLENRKLVAHSHGAVGRGERMRQPAQPAAEESVDILGAEIVADLLQRNRVVAGEEAVLQFLVADPLALELTLGPLVAVDPDADAERSVRGELDEAEAEVAVEDVEVILVDVELASIKREARRAATAPRAMPTAGPFLEDAEGGDHLLRHADQHHPFLSLEAGLIAAGGFFLFPPPPRVDPPGALALCGGVES